jgi:nucleoid DNA-binding protein
MTQRASPPICIVRCRIRSAAKKNIAREARQLRQTPKISLHCAGRKASEPRKPGFPTIEMNYMATKTTAKKAPAKAAKPAAAKSAAPVKPLNESLSKSGLIAHIAAQANVEAKAVKAVLASLESAVLASVHKKGVGQFTLPGLFKINAVKVAAKPKRKGKNPFTGEEQVFAAKPATVKVKVRPLKKLKDAAL